jgi:hypothetical protein
MRRVLMISPQFPPDSGAATHRVRLLAPHLRSYGWDPTVLTVDPRDYEGRLDPGLQALVPSDLRVIRCRAWPARLTRAVGVGDLGLRAFTGLRARAAELLEGEGFDALFITIFPTYPAMLGPALKRRFGVPFVLDYIDPWIGAWGDTVGGGPDGRPDWKSRLSRAIAAFLEPRAVRAADAITAVSDATWEQLRARYPALQRVPCVTIPFGGEPADFERARRAPRPNDLFDPDDGNAHVCYAGTLLPLGDETLRAVLHAVRRLAERRPELYRRLRLHFVGTSNQTAPGAPARALSIARAIGVADVVRETSVRIDYLDALTVQTQATALLLLGSSEAHYTASKLYPALLARRPILAVCHEASSVVDVLAKIGGAPAIRMVTYGDDERAETRVDAIGAALEALVERPDYDEAAIDRAAMDEYRASALAGRLARVLDGVARQDRG